MASKAPGEGATPYNPPATQSVYTSPVTATPYNPPVTQGIYTPPVTYVAPPMQGPIQYIPPEQTWVPGVPNFVTGVTALALGYALYKTFFETPTPRGGDERENPNRIPSVQTIQDRLGRRAGEKLPMEAAKQIRRALEKYVADPHGEELYGQRHHKSHARTHALNEVSKILGGSGAEHISDRDGDTVLSYVNMGDTYTPTIYYDGNFGVGDYGSWVESYEKRHGRLP
ncbi:MAG: hypothetical protein ABI652_00960 [Acidobacteriota bacterium]